MRIMVVDDHQLVLDGFKRILHEASYQIIGSFTDSREALKAIVSEQPDIVLCDLDMPYLNGEELIKAVREKIPEQKFILLTMHLNQQLIKKMMGLKLNGYLSKNAHPDELLEAVLAVSKGRNYFSSEVTESLAFKGEALQQSNHTHLTLDLSDREREVLKLIALGESTKMIADQLNISVGTVETHRGAIMKKLAVKNVAGMVRIAVQEGLV
ncbi:MAG: response regulator transcription factor [Flavobacteriia bacterium]|nr:response regulator transcription factor [Flavobacteriia bacterium]